MARLQFQLKHWNIETRNACDVIATSHLIATTKAVTLFRVVTGDIELAESQRSNIGATTMAFIWNTEEQRHGEYFGGYPIIWGTCVSLS